MDIKVTVTGIIHELIAGGLQSQKDQLIIQKIKKRGKESLSLYPGLLCAW